ncbi:jg9199 [Pararge aegeria aegeria]|uniref:Jg9199 protein n=1 Tax=Pararge aegeria aegeria TaxID=348720 RepID=A0A8S4S9I7_9NEOP|nr:jg9199 [Pararge aegeria aegeria]
MEISTCRTRSVRPEPKVDNKELKIIKVEVDPRLTTSDLAAGCGVSHKTELIHLKQIGKVKKLESTS